MSNLLSSADFKRLKHEAESRRRTLLDGIASARRELEALEGYLARLETTEKYVAANPSDNFEDLDLNALVAEVDRQRSLPEMVGRVLAAERDRAFHQGGVRGLKPGEISSEVKRMFGQDVSPRSVNSHVWYLYSRGRVAKSGMRYYLADGASSQELVAAAKPL